MDPLNHVRAAGLKQAIEIAFITGDSLFISGSFGLGKSAIVHQVAHAQGASVIEERVSQVSPEDAGIMLPDPVTNEVRRLTPDLIRRAWLAHGDEGKPVCLFLDEFTSASGMTQAAYGYELLHDRSLSGFKLPPNTTVIAAGNLATDRGITNRLPAPAANRCTHVHFAGPTFDEWRDYAVASKPPVNPVIVAALSQMPQYLCGKVDPDALRNPTPRTWEKAGRILDALPRDASDVEKTRWVATAVGDDAAIKVQVVLKLAATLPKFKDIIKHPETTSIPNDAAARYFTILTLVASAEAKDMRDVRTYVERFPDDYQSLFFHVMAAQKKHVLIIPHADWISAKQGTVGAGSYLAKAQATA